MWHPRRWMRVVLTVGGTLVVLVGLAAWSLETEYGGNGVIGSATSNGVTRVFDINEQSLDDEHQSVTTIVFQGTEAEARAFMDKRWNEGRNYTIPHHRPRRDHDFRSVRSFVRTQLGWRPDRKQPDLKR